MCVAGLAGSDFFLGVFFFWVGAGVYGYDVMAWTGFGVI